jgi:peptidoglycan/xylan/chitin deacetylase (PgdA/CDA1 family)
VHPLVALAPLLLASMVYIGGGCQSPGPTDTWPGGMTLTLDRGAEPVWAPLRLRECTPTTHPRGGTIALTFDDGPDPRWTPVILDILDAYGVKATFFVVGWKVNQHPELVAETLARGHSVQSHSYGHSVLTQLGSQSLSRDLSRSIDAIQTATGTRPTCLRPRQGITSSRVDAIAASLGLTMVIWDDDSGDWDHQSSAVLRRWAQDPNRWTDGDVILAHDTLGYVWQSVLGEVIESIRVRGLEFDTICNNPGHSPRPPVIVFIPV